MAKGASLGEVWKYTKQAVRYSKEMTKLRNEELQLKYGVATRPDNQSLKKKLAIISDKIAKHPFSPALAGGMIQSLGVEMLTRDLDSTQGLQVSIEDIFKKLTEDEKENLNKFNAIVKKLSKGGGEKIQMEYWYQALADKLNDTTLGKAPGKIINDMALNLKNIKNEDSAVKYLGELVAAPGSSLVKFGGAMTIYADIIPRWIIYKHNRNINMSEREAISDAINSLPNYVIGMPESLKFWSDLYITPFPSFYTRIQRVILTLAHKSPVSFAGHLVVNELIGGGANITGSNIFSKLMNGSFISAPTELDYIPYANIFD